jgi:Protein of unknown function (DUF2934)
VFVQPKLKEKPMIPEETIRLRSYLIWQQAGYPDGRALEHWLRAKAELEAAQEASLTWADECERIVWPRLPIMRPPQRLTSARIPPTERRAPAAERRPPAIAATQ